MATLNLGRIKPVFRGAYAGGTAYVVDDIVTSGDETFICILASTGNATSNATYWTKLAAKGTDGTNGTDVGTVITTQGDILYRDGSGLQRLPKGTAGQVLQMNSGATAPEYGTVSSDYVKLQSYTNLSGTSGNYISFDFSSLFSATYKHYKLIVNGMYNSSGSGHQLRCRLNVGGSLKSDGNYRSTGIYVDRNSSSGNTSAHGRWDTDYLTMTWLEDSTPDNDTAMEILFTNPRETGQKPKFFHQAQGRDNTYLYFMDIYSEYHGANGDIQGISFWGNSNSSIYFRSAELYGIK